MIQPLLLPLKIMHVPFGFYPDPVGGTEVYVASLAHELQRLGHAVLIAAPGDRNESYCYAGLPVRRFAVSPHLSDLRALYGAGDPRAAEAFAHVVSDERPDIVHLHALTAAVSLRLITHLKRSGIPVVFTYHTPTVSCQRGTLLRWGADICDGRLDAALCAACALHARGVPKPVALALTRLPHQVGDSVDRLRLSGGAWTALRMPGLVTLRHAALRRLLAEVDRIVVLCQWAADLLARNGVPPEKLVLARHGLPQPSLAPAKPAVPERSPLRLVALGRLDPAKGFDLLIRVVRSLPALDLRLDIYGVAQDEAGRRYLRRLEALAAGDSRICLRPPLPGGDVIATLARYDVLAVPSQWLETGPLVVLEAFAAGIPVLGSNLGGIAEWVTNEVDGLLVDPTSETSWCAALLRLANDAESVAKLKTAVKPPPDMQTVATQMESLYRPLFRDSRPASTTARPVGMQA